MTVEETQPSDFARHLCFGRDGRNSISRSTCTFACIPRVLMVRSHGTNFAKLGNVVQKMGVCAKRLISSAAHEKSFPDVLVWPCRLGRCGGKLRGSRCSKTPSLSNQPLETRRWEATPLYLEKVRSARVGRRNAFRGHPCSYGHLRVSIHGTRMANEFSPPPFYPPPPPPPPLPQPPQHACTNRIKLPKDSAK